MTPIIVVLVVKSAVREGFAVTGYAARQRWVVAAQGAGNPGILAAPTGFSVVQIRFVAMVHALLVTVGA